MLTLPPEDYVPRSKRMSFTPAISKKLAADKDKEQKRHDRAMKNPTEVTTTEIPDHVTPDGVKLPGWWQVQR
eukprot:UN14559